MLWVCRAGKESVYEDLFLEQERIFLPWNGYDFPLEPRISKEDMRKLVADEKDTINRTSISNWSGQLQIFAYEMKQEDYVLIPSKQSRHFTLASITGKYEYGNYPRGLHHARTIKILTRKIPKSIFSQSMIYSLGAYRTVFKVRNEDEALRTINHWIAEQKKGVINGRAEFQADHG